jgi:hypothetical protein
MLLLTRMKTLIVGGVGVEMLEAVRNRLLCRRGASHMLLLLTRWQIAAAQEQAITGRVDELIDASERLARNTIVGEVVPIPTYVDLDHWPVGTGCGEYASARKRIAFPMPIDGNNLSPVGGGNIEVHHRVARRGVRRAEAAAAAAAAGAVTGWHGVGGEEDGD